MKKKLLIFLSLIVIAIMLCGCSGNLKLIKASYEYGISNFYQSILTNFEDGLSVQRERINLGEDKSLNSKYVGVLEENANKVIGLLVGKEYIMASINSFIEDSSLGVIYSFQTNGQTKDFVVTKTKEVSLSISSKPYSEFKITEVAGLRLLQNVYIRLDAGKYEVAIPTDAEKTQFQVYTVEYEDGYLSLQITVNNVVYRAEALFDTQGVLYIVVNIGNEVNYEFLLGSNSVTTSYSLNILKQDKEETFYSLASRETIDDYGYESEYRNTIKAYHYYDGVTFKENSQSFNSLLDENNLLKLKYQAMCDVVEMLKGQDD